MRPWFHYSDVPDDIVAADMTKLPGTLASGALWSTASNPGGRSVGGHRQPRDPGVVAADAARIDVPVWSPAARSTSSRSRSWSRPRPHLTVATTERMAHMHNFASTRARLWQVIEDWLTALEHRKASGGMGLDSGPVEN